MLSLQCDLVLYVRDGPDRGRAFPLETQTLTLGRARAVGDRAPGWVLLNDPALERMHAELTWNNSDQSFYFISRASTPTLVNGTPVSQCRLKKGDQISLGSTLLELTMVADLPGSQNETQKIKLTPPLKAITKMAPIYQRTLEVVTGPQQGEIFTLTGNRIQIGGPATPNVLQDRAWWDLDLVFQDESFPYRCLSWNWIETEQAFQVKLLRPLDISVSFDRVADGIDWMTEMPREQDGYVMVRHGDHIIAGKTMLRLSITETRS